MNYAKLINLNKKNAPNSSNSKGGRRGHDRHEVKDPNAPKKPSTAYILYFQERKPKYVEKYPNMVITEITKLIGKE